MIRAWQQRKILGRASIISSKVYGVPGQWSILFIYFCGLLDFLRGQVNFSCGLFEILCGQPDFLYGQLVTFYIVNLTFYMVNL